MSGVGESPADLELVLRADAPAAAAGAAIRAVALSSGITSERATRLRALVEQLVLESRSREAVGGADDLLVRVRHSGPALHVDVHDRRLPLDPAEARASRARRLVALGFADHLHLSADGPDGNVATFSVEPDEEELTAEGGALAEDCERASDEVAEGVVIRRMVVDDAVGLARCVYRCYGYSYLDPLMYRPRQIRRALRAGTMRSVVAVTADGEVVGHVAVTFERPGDPVPEGGKLVVDPRFRGRHLAERLAHGRAEMVAEMGLAGTWSECVANHPFSQREVLSMGGSETGFLVGAQPATVRMEGVDNAVHGRHSLVAMYVPAADPGLAELHVPERHAAFLSGLVERLGVDREVVAHDTNPDAARPGRSAATALTVGVEAAVGLAHVRVERIGDDIVERMADELEALTDFDLDVVHLDVVLTDPAAPQAVEDLERLGFFWGAWVPCFTAAGDVLRLQRIADRPVDHDHVEFGRAEGEAVRDTVVAEWHRVAHGR
ncbi:MAG: GNAT family N-acetyltransferase [Microthrixaceae bacterium]